MADEYKPVLSNPAEERMRIAAENVIDGFMKINDSVTALRAENQELIDRHGLGLAAEHAFAMFRNFANEVQIYKRSP